MLEEVQDTHVITLLGLKKTACKTRNNQIGIN